MDLGITHKVNKKLELSASLIDVGLISWKQQIPLSSMKTVQYRYRGVMIAGPSLPLITDLTATINEIGDSLNNVFNPKHSERGFFNFSSGGNFIWEVNIL